MPKNLAEKIARQRPPQFSRYASMPDAKAIAIAHEDLLNAPDHMFGFPFEDEVPLSDYVCKMYATDVLKWGAMWVPTLITDNIIQDFQNTFSNCNHASRLNIVIILGLLRRADAVNFLVGVQMDPANSGEVADAAREALKVIRREREIGFDYQEGYINTFNHD